MKILLVGADMTVREQRRQLLAENGFDAVAVSPKDVGDVIADPQFWCLVLGSSLGDYTASDLAAHFCSFSSPRYVVRVAEQPPAKDYPYAHIVISPRNPAALLAAIKALSMRRKLP